MRDARERWLPNFPIAGKNPAPGREGFPEELRISCVRYGEAFATIRCVADDAPGSQPVVAEVALASAPGTFVHFGQSVNKQGEVP